MFTKYITVRTHANGRNANFVRPNKESHFCTPKKRHKYLCALHHVIDHRIIGPKLRGSIFVSLFWSSCALTNTIDLSPSIHHQPINQQNIDDSLKQGSLKWWNLGFSYEWMSFPKLFNILRWQNNRPFEGTRFSKSKKKARIGFINLMLIRIVSLSCSWSSLLFSYFLCFPRQIVSDWSLCSSLTLQS